VSKDFLCIAAGTIPDDLQRMARNQPDKVEQAFNGSLPAGRNRRRVRAPNPRIPDQEIRESGVSHQDGRSDRLHRKKRPTSTPTPIYPASLEKWKASRNSCLTGDRWSGFPVLSVLRTWRTGCAQRSPMSMDTSTSINSSCAGHGSPLK